jgi:hypothetical protein
VVEIVFRDKKLQARLPEFRHLFDQWNLSLMTPGLRSLGQRSVLDFLQGIDESHRQVISDYLGEVTDVDKNLFPHSVRRLEFHVGTAEHDLNKINPGGNVSTYREGDRLYVCFWR